MYIGHAALALVAKGRRPSIPVFVLVPVAFGPDWVQWFLQFANLNNRVLSHSIPAVLTGAILAAVGYRVWSGSMRDSVVVGALWLSHWPADFITGTKPTWPGGPDLGLMLYDFPVRDFVVESMVCIVSWLIYRRSVEADRRNSGPVWLVLVGLIAMQLIFNRTQGHLL